MAEDGTALEIRPEQLGTLELSGMWVPYADLNDEPFLPTRIRVGPDEYGFHSSMLVLGHGATLPQTIRELRNAGKKVLTAERTATGTGHTDRYFVFVSPP